MFLPINACSFLLLLACFLDCGSHWCPICWTSQPVSSSRSRPLLVMAKTKADDAKTAHKGNAKVVFGAYLGDVSTIRLGLHEGGSVDALLTPLLGEKVIRIGTYGVDFPYCPAVHAAVHEGTKESLDAAFYLVHQGADINEFQIPAFKLSDAIDRRLFVTGRGLGYPPAIMLALGLGMKPTNAHAALLHRLYRSVPYSFNFTKIGRWRELTGNPPLLQIPTLTGFFDGVYVLSTVMGVPLDESDCHGITALHIAAWLGDTNTVEFLLYSGMNRTVPDKNGRTALHYAAIRGHHAVIKSLLSDNADVGPHEVVDDESAALVLSKSQWANAQLPASTIKLQKRQYLMQQDRDGQDALQLALTAPSLPAAVSAFKSLYYSLGLSITTKLHTMAIPRNVEFHDEDLDTFLASGLPDVDVPCKLEVLLTSHTLSWQVALSKLSVCDPSAVPWRGGWFMPRITNSRLQGNVGSQLTVHWTLPLLTDDSALKVHHFGKNDIDHMQFAVDHDCDNCLGWEQFHGRYFIKQRPVIISDAFRGARIWAYWRKVDFLEKFGRLRAVESVFPLDTYGGERVADLVSRKMYDSSMELKSYPIKCRNDYTIRHESLEKQLCGINIYDGPHLFSLSTVDDEASSLLHDVIDIPDIFRLCSDSLPVMTSEYSVDGTACLTERREEWSAYKWSTAPSESVNRPVTMEVDSDGQTHTKDYSEFDADYYNEKSNIAELWQQAEAEDALFRREAAAENTEKMKLLLSPVGAGEPLHQHNASWSLLLTGIVHWFLIPPDSVENPVIKVLLNDWVTMADTLNIADRATQGTIKDVHNTSLRRNKRQKHDPEFFDLLATRYWMHSSMVQHLVQQKQLFQVTQFPGDTVFIPHNWYHASLSLADSISINREFCTFVNTDHRVQPLGSVLYGGADDFRGLGQVNTLSSERPLRMDRDRRGNLDKRFPVLENIKF
jgi:hypothetical protein